MSRSKKYKILSFKAVGVIIPHSLADIQHSLSRMGHRVYVVDLPAISDSTSREIAIMDALVQVDPDFVITIDNVGIIPKQYLELKPELKIISWFFDNPIHFLHSDYPLINSRYFLFCWDKAYETLVRQQGIEHFYHMPFGTNPQVYKEVECQKIYDLSFVGTWSKKRQGILENLAARGFEIDLFGDQKWKVVEHQNIRFHGFADNRRECPFIYQQSKINLNITNEQLLTSLPVRIFDVGATGAFLLTDAVKDAEEMFTEQELVIYRNIDDLEIKLKYFLQYEDKREEIALNLQKRINKSFTFEVLLDKIFQTVATEHQIPVNDPPTCFEQLWKISLSYLHQNKISPATELLAKALRSKVENSSLHQAIVVAFLYSAWKDQNKALVEHILTGNPSLTNLFSKLSTCDNAAELRSTLYGLKEHSFDQEGYVIKGCSQRIFAQ